MVCCLKRPRSTSGALLATVDCLGLLLVQWFHAGIVISILSEGNELSLLSLWYDVVLSGLFIISSVADYKHQRKQQQPTLQFSDTYLNGLFDFVQVIQLPCFAVSLFIKIVSTYCHGRTGFLNPQAVLNPQLFKFSIATSVIVYILILLRHRDRDENSFRNKQIQTLFIMFFIDNLDFTSLLHLVFIQEFHIAYMGFLPELVVLAIIGSNYILFSICASIFINQEQLDIFKNVNAIRSIVFWYRLLRLLLTDAFLMGFWIYRWSNFRCDISIFLLKNIFFIIWELSVMIKSSKHCSSRGSAKIPDVEAGNTGDHSTSEERRRLITDETR